MRVLGKILTRSTAWPRKLIEKFNNLVVVVWELTHWNSLLTPSLSGTLPVHNLLIELQNDCVHMVLWNSSKLYWHWMSVWFFDSILNYLILTSTGIQLKDLIALHTALPDTVGGNLLNVKKMIRLSNIMSRLLQAQTSPPALQPNLELIKMLRVRLISYHI